ncbi:hypothetical protein CN354_28425 [Bacillus cereus]|nr:hypothetical protein CN354_28425 [Bacillus cereus]
MPLPYQRTPFNSNTPVFVAKDCHTFGARDIGFNGIQWQTMRAINGVVQFGSDGRILFNGTGTPVYAVEPGTVVFVNRTTTCYDIEAVQCNEDHSIVIRGSDGYFTEYAHVYPSNVINVGSIVAQGAFLGNVDNSGNTTGPHVHFARWNSNPNWNPSANNPYGWQQNGATCEWTMNGLVPFRYTGWWRWSDRWFYIINGTGYRIGWYTIGTTEWRFDNVGAWTGWFRREGNTYFRTQNGLGPLKTGWLCWEGQWFYFNNNGVMLFNTTIGQFQLGFDGACLNCQQYPCS